MDHVVLLLLCFAPVVHCYSSGLVTESCADLRPYHNGLSPQTGPAPFTIMTDRNSYRLGEEITGKEQHHESTKGQMSLYKQMASLQGSASGSKLQTILWFPVTGKTGGAAVSCGLLHPDSSGCSAPHLQSETSISKANCKDCGCSYRCTCSSVGKRALMNWSHADLLCTPGGMCANACRVWLSMLLANTCSGSPAQVLYQRPGSLRVLCSILGVPRTALFWTETSDVVPGICWSHSPSLWVTAPSAPITTGTTVAITPIFSSSSFSPWSIFAQPAPGVLSGVVDPRLSNISNASCGVTKVCLSQPSNCDPAISADCYFMSASMSPSDAAVRYEITGPSDGYISFGFSDDQKMGNDDIYICGIGSNGLVWLKHAFSTGEKAPQVLPLGNVSDVTASVQGMVISCSFTSMNPISTQRTTGFNRTYYLMFAHGPSSNGQIQFHADTFISSDKVDISRPQLVRIGGWPNIIKAHGSLMLIAWMTTGSLGMMVARYLKEMAKGQNLWGKDVWFLVHVAVMSLTVAATAIAFILSFIYAKDWSGGAHPVLGCLVMILSFLQPILALLRCGPQHTLRFLFNWIHALNAVAIKILAVAAICTGLTLIDSTLGQWLIKVMGGFVGWEAVFYILLEVHLKWKIKRTDTLESTMKSVDVLLMTIFFMGNLAFLVALLVGIGMS
ncbi:putative ferric-chelate reductase 1 [Thunnus thynnus]|uniref:putative ferric-chelate reductase 1 n=1 Tax=Thunnus thynnus TaxID=8237 RepID=UPI00352726E7